MGLIQDTQNKKVAEQQAAARQSFGRDGYRGTIDLANRPVINNPDGTISTERSFSFSPDNQTEIVIPQIVNGREVSQEDAIKHFYQTGEHLGTFGKDEPGFSYEGLDNYASNIHNEQDRRYNGLAAENPQQVQEYNPGLAGQQISNGVR
jgi:hypothetical protein